VTQPTYAPQGITRPGRKGPHPGVKSWKGRPVQSRLRQISLRVPAKQYKDWLRASGAIEYQDLRNWLISLADREAEATYNPS
jgi:hypothetical protein